MHVTRPGPLGLHQRRHGAALLALLGQRGERGGDRRGGLLRHRLRYQVPGGGGEVVRWYHGDEVVVWWWWCGEVLVRC